MEKKIKRTFFSDDGFSAIKMAVEPFVVDGSCENWIDVTLDINDGYHTAELIDCTIWRKSKHNTDEAAKALNRITIIEKYLQRTRKAINDAVKWSDDSTQTSNDPKKGDET